MTHEIVKIHQHGVTGERQLILAAWLFARGINSVEKVDINTQRLDLFRETKSQAKGEINVRHRFESDPAGADRRTAYVVIEFEDQISAAEFRQTFPELLA